MKIHSKRGFTLVELLVVIAIIGALVAILVPAVNVATGIARKNSCLNNQRSWAQSMELYASDKGYYPGRINPLTTEIVTSTGPMVVNVSWMTTLLPYVEQGNMLDLIKRDPTILSNPTSNNIIEIAIATCASDPPEAIVPGRASFVMNSGVWDEEYRTLPFDRRANGVGQNLAQPNPTNNRVDPSYISKNDGTGMTLLLSENLNALSWHTTEETLHGLIWTTDAWVTQGVASTEEQIYAINQGISGDVEMNDAMISATSPMSVWQPGSKFATASTTMHYARPSSRHKGGVNAMFCDGHGKFISQDIDWTVYARLLTPAGAQSNHPHDGVAPPFQLRTLSEAELNP